jgi:DNA modification methylase
VQLQKVDYSWSFKELSRAQTSYLTHDYHKYPAKFIPQLTRRLIKENSRAGDLVCDPFMGSGTTLVEALINGRRVYGTDINPVAVLISRAKTNPIEPEVLNHHISLLLKKIRSGIDRMHERTFLLSNKFGTEISENDRIDYWFPEKQKKDLANILASIIAVDDENIQTFFLCAFSNILKACSKWMMKSIKPTRDKDKLIADPYDRFTLQIRKMASKNDEFWREMHGKKFDCVVDNSDARHILVLDDSASLFVTSPPYVTSYEYADLHQLTAIWLGYTRSLAQFRTRFIGSMQRRDTSVKISSELGKETVNKLRMVNRREARAIEQYFSEMQLSFLEMYRSLKCGGRACIVIGNTNLRKVEIKNADIFADMMDQVGFKIHRIIKRPIPNKILPFTRDEKTGRFATASKADRLAYPTEQILISEKT